MKILSNFRAQKQGVTNIKFIYRSKGKHGIGVALNDLCYFNELQNHIKFNKKKKKIACFIYELNALKWALMIIK